jgi:hypothetical protein
MKTLRSLVALTIWKALDVLRRSCAFQMGASEVIRVYTATPSPIANAPGNGFLAQAQSDGVGRYQITAELDERTCGVCLCCRAPEVSMTMVFTCNV